jgi:hypothetical protein
MTDTHKEEITPDQLLQTFHGASMKTMIIFTVVVHVVGMVATSGSYLWNMVAGADSSKLGEKERMELAAQEATSSLRQIASKHGLKAEDLSNRFAGSASSAPASEESPGAQADKPKEGTPAASPEAAPEKPKSAMEKEINTKEAGPALPSVLDEKEDLFK